MSEVQLKPAETFDQAYEMICEGFCPNCGGGLHRRPGLRYGFCIVHDMGWMAVRGEIQSVIQCLGRLQFVWIADGTGTCSDGRIFSRPVGLTEPWLPYS